MYCYGHSDLQSQVRAEASRPFCHVQCVQAVHIPREKRQLWISFLLLHWLGCWCSIHNRLCAAASAAAATGSTGLLARQVYAEGYTEISVRCVVWSVQETSPCWFPRPSWIRCEKPSWCPTTTGFPDVFGQNILESNFEMYSRSAMTKQWLRWHLGRTQLLEKPKSMLQRIPANSYTKCKAPFSFTWWLTTYFL